MKLLFSGIMEKLCLLLNKNRPLLWPQPVVVFCLAFVFSFLGAWGQPKGEGSPSPAGLSSVVGSLALAPLSVGDTLPPTTLLASLPAKARVTIPQAGKLTLLYFWETRCSNCWGKFPFLDSMRKKFSGRLEIITITPEPEEKATNFIHSVAKISKTQLPTLTAETLLHQRFPHVMLSHVAWVDGNGRVLAITGPDYVTESNIRYLLAGNIPNWPVKADLVKYDGVKPLLSFNKPAGYNINLGMPEYFFWSSAIAGLEGKMYRDNKPEGTRITFINSGFRTILSMAFGPIPHYPNRCLIADSLFPYFFFPTGMYYEDWLEKYATCFELYIPGPVREAQIDQRIKGALESRFNAYFIVDTAEARVWQISGKGLPVSELAKTVKSRVNAWNNTTPVPLVYHPAAVGVGLKEVPSEKVLKNFNSLAAWCAQNNLGLKDTIQRIRILKIEPKH